MVVSFFYVLFAILPLVFFPKTSEVFEFNKIIILYIFTVLITSSWIIKMIQVRKIIFKRTLIDIPLLIFFGSQLISTILSIDIHTSIFGYYGRFNGGILPLICYLLLYFAFTSNFYKEKLLKLVKIMLISGSIISIYGILEHFGYSISCLFVTHQFNNECWVQDVQTRVFATLGQPNWLAAYLVALTPLALNKVLIEKENKTKIIYMVISVIFFVCILFTKSRSGLLGLAVALVIFGLFNLKKHVKKLLVISILFSICVIIFGTPWTPRINDILSNKSVEQSIDTSEGGTESGSIRTIVWKGAIDIWKHYPFFGTGVETFAYSYWNYRPVEHNSTSEWDYLYNKAHNEYLNVAANTGTAGLLTYLILIFTSIYILRKSPSLLASYISILITNFFGFSVVVISFLSFLFPAMSVVINLKRKDEYIKKEENQKVFIGGVILVSLFIMFLISKYWYADYLFAQGKQNQIAGQYDKSITSFQEAIKNNPSEAIYHNEISRLFTSITSELIDRSYATDAARFASFALDESDSAFNISPRNMNIRESRINTYLQLGQIEVNYVQKAIDLTNETIEISPTDPKLYVILGKAYANNGSLEKAEEAFNKALELKPDYNEAQKDLELLEKLQDKNK